MATPPNPADRMPFAKSMAVTATCTPVQRGKRLSVWQTHIVREDGKAVALVTQTQMVL